MSETVTKDTTSKGTRLERERHTYKREQLKEKKKMGLPKRRPRRYRRKKYTTLQENQNGATKAQIYY